MLKAVKSRRTGAPLRPGAVLKILFYVDKAIFLGKYDTRLLQEALLRDPNQLNVEIDVKIRDKAGWLTLAHLSEYHEIWLFLAKETADGPLLPLLDLEVEALRGWMSMGRGVLITGDHASGDYGKVYEGLGAHVGERFPRAGQMRVWGQEPGVNDEDRVDTTDSAVGTQEAAEVDARPQRLLVCRFTDQKPHPIFSDSRGNILDRFADHRHEGMVKVPEPDVVKKEWPGARAPVLIAKSIDWRRGQTSDLMAAWDGHWVTNSPPQHLGRIVADSSFHHYVDDNLIKLADVGGRDWKTIEEIFRNQAAWLAPPDIRQDYRERALDWLLDHPYIEQAIGLNDNAVVEIAGSLLAEVLPGAWYREFADDVIKALNTSRPRTEGGIVFDPYVVAATIRHRIASGRPQLAGDGSALLAEARVVYDMAVASYSVAVAAKKAEMKARVAAGRVPERED